MQTCKNIIPAIYTTNYGKMIEILIASINHLSRKFLKASSFNQKECIKGNIAILRKYLSQHTKSEHFIDDQKYREFQSLIDTMLAV